MHVEAKPLDEIEDGRDRLGVRGAREGESMSVAAHSR